MASTTTPQSDFSGLLRTAREAFQALAQPSAKSVMMRQDKAWQDWINFNTRIAYWGSRSLNGDNNAHGAPQLFNVVLTEDHFKSGKTRDNYIKELKSAAESISNMRYDKKQSAQLLEPVFTATFGKSDGQRFFSNFVNYIEGLAQKEESRGLISPHELTAVILGERNSSFNQKRSERLTQLLTEPLQVNGSEIRIGKNSLQCATDRLRNHASTSSFVEEHLKGLGQVIKSLEQGKTQYIGGTSGALAGLSGQENTTQTPQTKAILSHKQATGRKHGMAL